MKRQALSPIRGRRQAVLVCCGVHYKRPKPVPRILDGVLDRDALYLPIVAERNDRGFIGSSWSCERVRKNGNSVCYIRHVGVADNVSDNELVRSAEISLQLTDGGPFVTPEFPSCVAGPPFGAALGSAFVILPINVSSLLRR